MGQLFGLGGVCFIFSWLVGAPAKHWFEGIGTLALAAGLLVFLVGTIAGRKELESKQKNETK
jgi:hypothetical protein